MQPGYQAAHGENSQKVIVMGDVLHVSDQTSSEIALLYRLCTRYAQNGRSFLATPFWPGAYAIMGRKSPTWEIYTVFPQTESFQQAEIERLRDANIGFAVITDFLLDDRRDLLYASTHSSIERHIRDNFKPLSDIGLPSNLRVFVAVEKK